MFDAEGPVWHVASPDTWVRRKSAAVGWPVRLDGWGGCRICLLNVLSIRFIDEPNFAVIFARLASGCCLFGNSLKLTCTYFAQQIVI